MNRAKICVALLGGVPQGVVMPFVIGGLTAIIALTAGIFGHVDPMAILTRSGIAFGLGLIATQIWMAITQVTQTPDGSGIDEGEPTIATEGQEG